MTGVTPPSFLMDLAATESEDDQDADVASCVDSVDVCELPYGWRKCSGLQSLPGVGPKLATVISAELGENAYDAIIENPDILSAIKGIGDVKLADIREFIDGMNKDKKASEEDQPNSEQR